MTPEEHYQRGLALLEEAERISAVDHSRAQTLAVIATPHFQAAVAGVGMRAMEIMNNPLQTVSVPAPDGTNG